MGKAKEDSPHVQQNIVKFHNIQGNCYLKHFPPSAGDFTMLGRDEILHHDIDPKQTLKSTQKWATEHKIKVLP